MSDCKPTSAKYRIPVDHSEVNTQSSPVCSFRTNMDFGPESKHILNNKEKKDNNHISKPHKQTKNKQKRKTNSPHSWFEYFILWINDTLYFLSPCEVNRHLCDDQHNAITGWSYTDLLDIAPEEAWVLVWKGSVYSRQRGSDGTGDHQQLSSQEFFVVVEWK